MYTKPIYIFILVKKEKWEAGVVVCCVCGGGGSWMFMRGTMYVTERDFQACIMDTLPLNHNHYRKRHVSLFLALQWDLLPSL